MDQRILHVKRTGGLLLLTAVALLIHGYHPYAEDAEIYLPGVLKILNPGLFPAHAEFFGEHAGHTLYPNLIAFSVRATHLPLPWVAFLWHLMCIFLLLAASWRLASVLFEGAGAENESACWGSAALMAALLTLPVAGTALYILDQYLNPRNLAAFAALFAVAAILRRSYVAGAVWLVFAALVHPLMASFAIAFCVWLVVLERYRPRALGFAALLPFGLTLDPPPPAYHEVALRQPYFYIQRWQWYEWLGLVGPVILFWMLARFARRRRMDHLELVSRATVPFVVAGAALAILLSVPQRFEALARVEPLRCLALTYMLLIVIGGGLLGQYILPGRSWRWLALFVPLALGMHIAQHQLFPASAHVEWPWAQPRNRWAQAFEWIRGNTPVDALFALDPRYMQLPGEDENGFRARAERSRLADLVKDKGACSMFPPLSVKWWEQIEDQKNWPQFGKEDFERLRQKYGVSWVVVEQPGVPGQSRVGIECPYENSAVRVCRVN
jgi:hypothetical protein